MSTSWDDFLVHVADLRRFAPGQDADGGVDAPYPDGAPYAAAEPCYVEFEAAERMYDDQKRVTQVFAYTVFLGRNPGVAMNDRIDWVDAAGYLHLLFVDGPVDMTQAALTGLCEVGAHERAGVPVRAAVAAILVDDGGAPILIDDGGSPILIS